jgi:predicted house-cleaning noncanonical NTP pyrophosphatase (MazG superfamily)
MMTAEGHWGVTYDTNELRAWRDRVEARLGAHQVHLEHGAKEHDRHRESIKELSERLERTLEQLRAQISADHERESAATRLAVNERLAQHERVMADRLDQIRDELRPRTDASPAPLPWRIMGVIALLASTMLIAVGIAIGVTINLQTITEIAQHSVAS